MDGPQRQLRENPAQITGYDLRGADGKWIGSVLGEHCFIPAAECHANARLIAQAPNLRDAVEELLSICTYWMGDHKPDLDAVARARALLKAIEG